MSNWRTQMKTLRFSDKIRRLRTRLRNKEWRRYGALLLTGKLMGMTLILLAIMFINPSLLGLGASAQSADPVLKGNDIVNPVNTMWTLVAAFLVFGMQVGFTMLEAGFCWRPALQRLRHRLHLPNHWTLGVGSRWLACQHGEHWKFLTFA